MLMIMPTFCFGYSVLDADLAQELAFGSDYAYKLVEMPSFVDTDTARSICNKIYLISKQRNWPPVKVYRSESNDCGVLDLESACNTKGNIDGLRHVTMLSAYYYNMLFNEGRDICEEQIIPCEQVLVNIVKSDIETSIRLQGYGFSDIPKDIDVQCSVDDNYCVANWPCVGSLFSGKNCYTCKQILKKSETCNPINLVLSGFHHVSSDEQKKLTDFDKDCNPLFKE